MKQDSDTDRERIIIKANYKMVPVYLDEIIFIKALSDYVIIRTTTEKWITLSSMKDMQKNLPEATFNRCHRSFMVKLDKIKSVRGSTITLEDNNQVQYSVPIGRAYRNDFDKAFKTA